MARKNKAQTPVQALVQSTPENVKWDYQEILKSAAKAGPAHVENAQELIQAAQWFGLQMGLDIGANSDEDERSAREENYCDTWCEFGFEDHKAWSWLYKHADDAFHTAANRHR